MARCGAGARRHVGAVEGYCAGEGEAASVSEKGERITAFSEKVMAV